MFSLRLDPSRKWLKVSVALKLSPRKFEVAWWVSEGKTNGDIAGILGISPRTVQKHVENIFERLGAESRVEVTRRMIEKSHGRPEFQSIRTGGTRRAGRLTGLAGPGHWFRAIRPYQMPEAMKTRPQPVVNQIRNGDGK